MKIKYQFADGKVAEIEVSEEFGTLYLETERQEQNAERRQRYHCRESLDYLGFENEYYADETYAPERLALMKEEEERVAAFLATLTERQRSLVLKLMNDKNIEQIAREEGVHRSTLDEALKSVRKKAMKFFF